MCRTRTCASRETPDIAGVNPFPWSEITSAAKPFEAALELQALRPPLFGSDQAPTEAEDRAALVHNAMYDHIREHEVQFRLFLRNALLRSLDTDATDEPLRRAGRLDLLEAALEPLEGELDTEALDRLKAALSILIGTEATIVLRDVLRLDHEQARAEGEWAVRHMIRAARQSP